MPLSATVAELKVKIQSETGEGELRLIYAGRILKDGDTLASHCEPPRTRATNACRYIQPPLIHSVLVMDCTCTQMHVGNDPECPSAVP